MRRSIKVFTDAPEPGTVIDDAKLSAAQRRNLKADDYAVPGKKKLPIHDTNHIEAAWRELPATQGLTSEERTEAKKKILAAAKKHGIDTSKWDGVTNTDMVVGIPTLLTDSAESSDGKMRLRFKVTQTNVVNSNRRLYPDPVVDAMLEGSKDRMQQNRMVGESPHPKHYVAKDGSVVFDSKLENNVVKWFNQFKDENGVVFADCEVLSTRLGQDLKACVDAGIPVGVSMRALGDSVRKTIGGAMVDVATRLDLLTYDIVMNPATTGCEVVSVLTDSQVQEAMTIEDGAEITAPTCPSCGGPLVAMDPDNDGDLDFYACENEGLAYIPEEDVYVVHQATQRLRSLPNDPDWDGYSLAKQWMMAQNKNGGSTVATDSTGAAGPETTPTQEGESEMDIKEILAALKDSPEFNAIVDERAQQIAQPALDNAAAQAQAAAAAQAAQETRTFIDSKLVELKGRVADDVIQAITDSVKEVTDKDAATLIIDTAIAAASKAGATAKLDNAGGVPTQEGGTPVTRVQYVNEQAPQANFMREMMDAFDRVALEQGHDIDPSIRKVNREFIDKMVERSNQVLTQGAGGRETFKDSMAFIDSAVVNEDSISVSTTQLLNQPVISQLLMIEAFQDVESLQFMASEVFDGDEIRWPVETFTSAATINPATGIADLLVAEGQGIPESSINLGWITYNPDWRRNAVSLTTDVIKTLKSGPAKYDAVARALFHIAFDKRRKLDLVAYLEMCMASDEYDVTAVASETIPAGQLTAGAAGSNVAYVGNLTVNGTATSTAGSNPVVRPRTKRQHLPGGAIQTTTSNPFTVKVNGTTLNQGYQDASGNVQSGDYAVDYENGKIYFATSAGLNPGATTPVLPAVTYSAVTNYVRWSYTIPNGKDADQYYNTLLQLITTQRAAMRAAPRFLAPNLGIMSETTAAYIENAAMWYRLNSPDIGNLSGLADSTYFGTRSGVNLARINAPWAGGDGRILLTQKGATRYGVETPYQVKGPYPKYDASQNIIDAEIYYGRENSVMATPQVVDTNGHIINPKSKTIKIVP